MFKSLKSINLVSALAMVALFTTLQSSSCSKDDVTGTDPGNITGGWRVSLYWDNGTDESYKFSGYTFTFNSGGTVIAVKGASTINGTWSESSTRFVLSFGTDPVFSKLNHSWLKTEKTATTLKMKDDNPSKDETLEFIKI